MSARGIPVHALSPVGPLYGKNPYILPALYGNLRAIPGADRRRRGNTEAGTFHQLLAKLLRFESTLIGERCLPPYLHVELTLSELKSLKSHQQFLLLNSHRQRCDSYVTYRGVRISELLRSQGVDVGKIEGITVFAPDGFARTYTREQVTREYPAGVFRLVRPQTKPSRPDRGSSCPLGDEYDYIDSLDHNAGDSVRGVTVIRVDPMPDEYEEFDAMNASWRFLTQKKLVIYGHGIR